MGEKNHGKFIFAWFLVISFFMNFIFVDKATAKQVQVSDVGVYKFYDRIYKVNEMCKTGKTFDELKHIDEKEENSPYDIYCTGFGEDGHAVLVTLYADKTGCISKITVFGKKGDALVARNIGLALGCILFSLGLNGNEFNYVIDKMQSDGSSNIFGKKINRRITLEKYSANNQVLAIRITAYDN